MKGIIFLFRAKRVLTQLLKYSQTCFSDHLSTKTTFFVSLENGTFLLVHVLKLPVYKDHFLCLPSAVAIDRLKPPNRMVYRQVWLYMSYAFLAPNRWNELFLQKYNILVISRLFANLISSSSSAFSSILARIIRVTDEVVTYRQWVQQHWYHKVAHLIPPAMIPSMHYLHMVAMNQLPLPDNTAIRIDNQGNQAQQQQQQQKHANNNNNPTTLNNNNLSARTTTPTTSCSSPSPIPLGGRGRGQECYPGWPGFEWTQDSVNHHHHHYYHHHHKHPYQVATTSSAPAGAAEPGEPSCNEYAFQSWIGCQLHWNVILPFISRRSFKLQWCGKWRHLNHPLIC